MQQQIPNGIVYSNTEDYVYLIGEKEITGKNFSNSAIDSKTRQLDYYLSQNYNSSTNMTCAIKKYKNSDAIWLLRDRVVYRTVYSYDLSIINTTGNISPMTSLNNSYGVAPAFRIG